MLAPAPRLVLLLVTALLLALTLTPVSGPGSGAISFDIIGFRGIADALVNVLLFIPFGAAAAACFTGKARPVLAGAVLSLVIESAQLMVPGRFVSPADVTFNTTGAALGMMLLRSADIWLHPSGRLRWLVPGGAMAASLAALVGGSFMFGAAIPRGVLYGQWTARFENMAPYEGEVRQAYVGALAVPSRRIARSDSLRLALLRGDTVLIHATAGPPPPALAPIFSIYDEHAHEMLLFGADGEDAVVRFRMRATAAGLDQPEIRVRDAFEGAIAGSDLQLRFWAEGRGWCVEVAARRWCDLGFTMGDTWSLLLYPLPRTVMPWFAAAWMMALLIPAGLALRQWRGVLISASVLLLALLVIPSIAGILQTPADQAAGGLAGLAAGHLSGRVIRGGRASAYARSARCGRTPDRRSPQPDRTGP